MDENMVSALVSLGTVIASGIGFLTVRSAVRDIRRQSARAINEPKPKHVSVSVRYDDGTEDHLEVDPTDPRIAEDALRELRSA